MNTRSFSYTALIIIGLVVLFAGLSSRPKDTAPFSLSNPTASASSPSSESGVVSVSLTIQDLQLVSGSEVTQVKQGQTVVFSVTSNQAEELHLHGYNQSVDLVPGETTELRVVADKTGHFEYELEQSGKPLGALEVLPN